MSETRRTTIDICKEDIHFSAGHFTIFSATERENLHGHNFFVEASAEGPIGSDGLCFDYNALKSRLRQLCGSLDEVTLLPTKSPHLDVQSGDTYVTATFDGAELRFLLRDVRLLPVANVTVESLAGWMLDELRHDAGFDRLPIDRLRLRVSSGPGQWASADWRRLD